MKRFTFFLNIEGTGDTPKEAWENAMERLVQGVTSGEYSDPPGIIYDKDEEIPGAELLSGAPYQEFGINHGEEEVEEINPHGMPED